MIDCIKVHVKRIKRVSATIERLHKPRASVSRICVIPPGFDNYLRVTPEVAWIYDDMPAIFQIESNTKWNVE